MIVVCVVGPLARWSTGPRQPVSPSTRQPVSWVLPCFGLDLACFLGKPKLTQTGGRRERAKRRCCGRRLGGSPVVHHCRHCPRGSGGIVACGPPRFVDSLAGLRPVLVLIRPVFRETPANAGAGGRRGGHCWLQLTEAGHLAGVWQAQVRARRHLMVDVRASTLPDPPISPQKAQQNPRPGSHQPPPRNFLGYLRLIRSSRNCHQGGATLRLTSWCWWGSWS